MIYEIVIEGYVKETRFEGFEMIKQSNSTTVLRGPIVDQSALFGVLRVINDLGIDLISVNRLEEDLKSKVKTMIRHEED